MSARINGLRAWFLQRLSAIFLAAFLLYALLDLALDRPFDYAHWHAWVAHPVNNILLQLAFIAVLVHAWIGLRDVVLDYVHNLALRVTLLSVLGITLLALGLWAETVLLGAMA